VAPGEREAEEFLDRFEALEDPAQGVQVAVRAGRALVGLGAPGFARADVRRRVAELSRTHPDRGVRVALFVHCVPALQEGELLEKALGSDDAEVRTAAAREFVRRGALEPAWGLLRAEADPEVSLAVLQDAPRGVPLAVLEAVLAAGRGHSALEEAALLRLSELEQPEADAALALLAPWLAKGRETNAGAALWAAGLVGAWCSDPRAVGEQVLARLAREEELGRVGLGVEALARLGHPAAAEALQSFGGPLLGLGPWGEELVDASGVLLGLGGDAREVLGRFLVTAPAEPTRTARALEVAARLAGQGRQDLARAARPLLPSRLARFAGLDAALGS